MKNLRCLINNLVFLDWTGKEKDDQDISVWEDNWEDDNVEDDFNKQLRAQLNKQKSKEN